MNKKLLSGILASLFTFANAVNCIQITAANEVLPTSGIQIEDKSKNINFEITKEQAVEDINYVLKIIKDNHVTSLEKIPDEVTNQAKAEMENLPDKINVVDEWKTILRIISKLHDAHTNVLGPSFLFRKRLPIDIKVENKKFICAGGKYQGCEIIAINDIGIDDLYDVFKKHLSYEIEEWAQYNFFEFPSDYIPESKLVMCGIDTSEPIKVSFNTESGIVSDNFQMTDIEANTKSDCDEHYYIDDENNVGIFTFNRCFYDDIFADNLMHFIRDLLDKKIENVVIDLRENYGGNYCASFMLFLALTNSKSFITHGFRTRENDNLEYYPPQERFSDDIFDNNSSFKPFDGNVFILTSHATFSAAVDIATMFSDNNKAKIVGEIPGGSPSCCGFSTPDFYLPNSKLIFFTTCGRFERPDKTKNGDKLIPDVQVPAKEALEKVYEIIKSDNK